MANIKQILNELKEFSGFKMKVINADPSKGFNFPYILIMPKSLPNKVKLMVECANSKDYEKGDGTAQSFEEQIECASKYAEDICEQQDDQKFNMPLLYQKLSQPTIIPIIERCEYERVGVIRPDEQIEKYVELDRLGKNTEFYPQQLGRQVMLEKDGKYAKLPEQVIAMVEDAKRKIRRHFQLRMKRIEIEEKSALVGFSSSSVFASRMQLICPEHFDTCISLCSGGTQPLPLTELNGEKLNYPLGVADFEQIFGKPFNAEEYAKANQLSIVGELEPNGSYNTALKPRLFDKSMRDLFLRVYGNLTLQERQIIIDQTLKQNGYNNIQCAVLQGVQHDTHGMGRAVLSWVENNMQHSHKQEQTIQK